MTIRHAKTKRMRTKMYTTSTTVIRIMMVKHSKDNIGTFLRLQKLN